VRFHQSGGCEEFYLLEYYVLDTVTNLATFMENITINPLPPFSLLFGSAYHYTLKMETKAGRI
jgi:hypothetical protein